MPCRQDMSSPGCARHCKTCLDKAAMPSGAFQCLSQPRPVPRAATVFAAHATRPGRGTASWQLAQHAARSIDQGAALLARADALSVSCQHSATLWWGGRRFKCWNARCCAQTYPFLLRTLGATATIRSDRTSLLSLSSLAPPSLLPLSSLPFYTCPPLFAP